MARNTVSTSNPPPSNGKPCTGMCGGAGGDVEVEVHDMRLPLPERVSYVTKPCPDCNGTGVKS
jgi:hypothetical protein